MESLRTPQDRGAQGIEHPVIHDAGRVLQEDAGEELVAAIVCFHH